MSNITRITEFLSSSQNQGGHASESWWFSTAPDAYGIANIAQARADMMGNGARCRAAMVTNYNILDANNNLKRVGRVAAVNNNGAGWKPAPWSPSNFLADAANKNVGCPIAITLGGGAVNTSANAAFPPLAITQDSGAPGVSTYSAIQTAWDTRVAYYATTLIGFGAMKRLKVYNNKFAITGGISGTPTSVAEVWVKGNQVSTFTPNLVVHVGGRVANRKTPHFKHDPLSGDHTVMYANYDSPTDTTRIGLTCTAQSFVIFDMCRSAGFIAPVAHNFLPLSAYIGNATGKGRRGGRPGCG